MAPGQLRVLYALDVARTQLYHFMAIVIAGMGFFTDAYDFFAISFVTDLIGYQYYRGHTPRGVSAAINGIALCGAVPGQLFFGWLGDKMGRKRIYGVTLLLMVVTSLASGLSFSKRVGKNVVTVLCFFRFWLGVGIGGDYPLSATIISEYANKRRRGSFIAAVFAMQGFGNLAAGVVGMVVSAGFRNSTKSNADFVWRIVLMFGAVPAMLTYYWRMKMPETARYTILVAKDARKGASDMSSVLNVNITPEDEAVNQLTQQGQYGLFSPEFLRRHGVHLLATSVCWLAVDVTFYSLNLFMPYIFTRVGLLPSLEEGDNPFEQMIKITKLHTTIALCGTLPGYFATVALVDRIGRVRIQILGFTMMSIFIVCLAVPYDHHWTKHKNRYGFAVMYGMTTFFANFGPNTTTFIIPAELFPARLRSTCHGIAGAFGKVGAVVGVFAFRYAQNHVPKMLFGLVGCNIVGILFTLLLPETKGKSLEEIAGEIEEQQPQQHADAASSAEQVQVVPV
ncbi:unnamed protein product [Urochloa humidicola]